MATKDVGGGGVHTPGPLWVSSSTIVCTPAAQIVANCTPIGRDAAVDTARAALARFHGRTES